MDQFVLLLIIGAISLINWILQKSAEHREKRKLERNRGETIQPVDGETTAQESASPFDASAKTRKFLEALGLPEEALPPRPLESAPPPIPQTRTTPEPYKPKRNFLHKARPDLDEQLRSAQNRAAYVVDSPPERTTRGSRAAATVTVARSSTGRTLIGDLRNEKEGLRKAIVLREILGPPKAFQSDF